VHGLRCSTACGFFPDQWLNPCPLHWQEDSQPQHHHGSLGTTFFFFSELKLYDIFILGWKNKNEKTNNKKLEIGLSNDVNSSFPWKQKVDQCRLSSDLIHPASLLLALCWVLILLWVIVWIIFLISFFFPFLIRFFTFFIIIIVIVFNSFSSKV